MARGGVDPPRVIIVTSCAHTKTNQEEIPPSDQSKGGEPDSPSRQPSGDSVANHRKQEEIPSSDQVSNGKFRDCQARQQEEKKFRKNKQKQKDQVEIPFVGSIKRR